MAIQEWLARAGDLLLSISFTEGFYPLADSSFIADAIEPYLHRCKTLALDVITPGFLPRTSSDLSIMESLSLSATARDGSSPHELWVSPQLRMLSVRELYINIAIIPQRWPLLTSLSIDGDHSAMHPHFKFKELVPLLRMTPGLVNGNFGFSPGNQRSDAEDSKTLDTIHLHRLEELSIFCDQPYLALNLVRCLDLPILRAVQITDAFAPVWDSGLVSEEFALLAAIAQTRETLRHLTINTRIYDRGEVYKCLKECQLLTTLSILGSEIDDEFLQRFIPNQGSVTQVLCPNLEHLEWEGSSRVTDSCLLHFIIQRHTQTPRIARLKSISGKFHRRQEQDIRPQLAKYIADGLRLTLKYRQDEEE